MDGAENASGAVVIPLETNGTATVAETGTSCFDGLILCSGVADGEGNAGGGTEAFHLRSCRRVKRKRQLRKLFSTFARTVNRHR